MLRRTAPLLRARSGVDPRCASHVTLSVLRHDVVDGRRPGLVDARDKSPWSLVDLQPIFSGRVWH